MRTASLLAFVAITLCAATAVAQSKWEVISRDSGVVVSKKDHPSLELPIIRGVSTLDEDFYDVLAVLRDTEHFADWMHNCKEARLLEAKDEFDLIVYNRVSTPWPLEDRDTVVRTRIKVDHAKKFVVIRFVNVTSRLQGEINGVTRMPSLEGFYKIEKIGPGKTRVTYQAQADPGGLIPNWLVERDSRDIPKHTIASLRKRVRATRGSYKEFLKRWSPELGGQGF